MTYPADELLALFGEISLLSKTTGRLLAKAKQLEEAISAALFKEIEEAGNISLEEAAEGEYAIAIGPNKKGNGREIMEVADWLIEESFRPLLLRRVDVLETSVRLANHLKNDNIVYIGDLVQKTEAEMLAIPGFGLKTLNETKELLDNIGLCLGMEVINWAHENIERLRNLAWPVARVPLSEHKEGS